MQALKDIKGTAESLRPTIPGRLEKSRNCQHSRDVKKMGNSRVSLSRPNEVVEGAEPRLSMGVVVFVRG